LNERSRWRAHIHSLDLWILLTATHTATHCNALQRTATHCNALQCTAMHCNALQHTATHSNALQRTATHCNTLQQHTATHWRGHTQGMYSNCLCLSFLEHSMYESKISGWRLRLAIFQNLNLQSFDMVNIVACWLLRIFMCLLLTIFNFLTVDVVPIFIFELLMQCHFSRLECIADNSSGPNTFGD